MNYKFILLIISVGILFRVSVFSAYALIGACYIHDVYKKKFTLIEKTKSLILKDKVFIFFLLSLPLLIISFIGTPAFEGVEQGNALHNFLNALNSKIIFSSFLKQIPSWYLFSYCLFFYKSKTRRLFFHI